MDDALLAFEGQAVDVGATYTHGCCAERQSFDQVRATAHAPPTHGKVIGIVGRPKSLFKKDLVLVIPELIQVQRRRATFLTAPNGQSHARAGS